MIRPGERALCALVALLGFGACATNGAQARLPVDPDDVERRVPSATEPQSRFGTAAGYEAFIRAELELAEGRPDDAAGPLETAHEEGARSTTLACSQAAAAISAGDCEAGLALCRTGLSRAPASACLWRQCSACLGERDAQRALRLALRLSPGDKDTLLRLAAAFSARSEPVGQDELLARARCLYPDDYEVLLAIARAAWTRGQLDTATRLLDRLLSLHPHRRKELCAALTPDAATAGASRPALPWIDEKCPTPSPSP